MISVILVTYNSRGHIGRCLDSLRELEQGLRAEIVVVDNASSDGTADLVRQRYPAVKLIASPTNLGFAAAANVGARHSTGDSLLFLNPDTVYMDSLRPLQEALESSDRFAAAAPRLVDRDGRTQVGFTVRRLPSATFLAFEVLLLNRLFPGNPVNRKYRCLDLDLERPSEVEQPAGACLMVRRTSFEACGGFDEAFFPLWFEDVDLCKRLRERGGAILFLPHVRVEHHGAHSLESVTFSEKQIYWYRNLLYYVRKHFPWTTGLALRGALVLGMGLRMAAELLGNRAHPSVPSRRERLRAYGKVARLSVGG
ncbi:MAG: glycosyltransferase family 2 protein [Terriglobia bacterium]